MSKQARIPGAFKDASLAKLRIGTSRKYPRFYAGMSTADYAAAYYELNHATQWCHFHTTKDAEFFAPLSTAPAAELRGPECVHEVLDDAGQWVTA